MITTVAEWFFKQHLTHTTLHPVGTLLSVAGGYSVPYLGYIEVDIILPHSISSAHKSYSTLVLVVSDAEYNCKVPLLIGTNLMKQLYYDYVHGSIMTTELPEAVKLAFQFLLCSEGVAEGHTCANCDFMPTVYTTIEQTVPANACMIVSGVADFPAHIGYMISESNETPLPGGLLLAPCIIAPDKETNSVFVEVQNFSANQ